MYCSFISLWKRTEYWSYSTCHTERKHNHKSNYFGSQISDIPKLVRIFIFSSGFDDRQILLDQFHCTYWSWELEFMGWKQKTHQFSCFSSPSSHSPIQCSVYHYLKSQRFCFIIIFMRCQLTVWEWPWLHHSESSKSQAISKGTQSLRSRAETSPPSVTGPSAEPALWGRN